MDVLEQLFSNIQTHITSHPIITSIVSYIFLKLVEVVPIKIYPLTWIKKKISKGFKSIVSMAMQDFNDALANKINELTAEVKDIKQDVSEVKNDVTSLQAKRDKDKALDMRREILNFGDDVADDKRKSKKNYERILFNVYPKYEKIITKYGLTNGQVTDSYNYLLSKYHENINNGSFKRFYGDGYDVEDADIDIESQLVKCWEVEDDDD